MSYIGLGSRMVTASLDTTGLNTGNYTCAFPQSIMNVNQSNYELYHAIVQNVPVGANAQVLVNNKPWGFTYPLFGSEWDPQQPMLLQPGDEVDFLWSIVASGIAPIVTVWLRYDPAIQPGGVLT